MTIENYSVYVSEYQDIYIIQYISQNQASVECMYVSKQLYIELCAVVFDVIFTTQF